MSSIAVLYGTTADDNVRPVLCNDFGQLVTDQSGGTNWYENLYIGGTSGDPSISLLSDGSVSSAVFDLSSEGNATVAGFLRAMEAPGIGTYVQADSAEGFICVNDNVVTFWANMEGTITTPGDVFARNFIPADGYDISKIGQALTTIHDVIESVDDLQGLKNLFHLLLDNLKSDPTPPTPPTPPEPSPNPPE